MSMVACDCCECIVDSDADPACFINADAPAPWNSKLLEQVLCENCRERAWDRQQERAMEG